MIRLNIRSGESVVKFGSPAWTNINDKPLTTDAVLRILEGARVCVLIHGYNVVEAMDAYARVVSNIGYLYDVVIGLTWPGSKVPAAYWLAERRADTAGKILASVFDGLPHRNLDVEGHSCGCRVALEAVKAGLKVRNLILAAAAVDNETVHIGEKYGEAVRTNVERCLVAHSRDDAVLKKAFRVSSWLKRMVRLKIYGDDCCALGYTGPQNALMCPPNVKAVDLSGKILRHGDYKRNGAFFAAWRQVVEN